MTERYAASSPYFATPQLSWRMGRYVHRVIPPGNDDQEIQVAPRHENRPDLLSYELYKTPAYWWVVANRNPALRANPVFGLKAGMYLIMPSAEHLMRMLGG